MQILGDASAMQVVVINVLPYTRYETCVITLSSKQSNEAVTQLHFETFKEFSGTHDSASDVPSLTRHQGHVCATIFLVGSTAYYALRHWIRYNTDLTILD